MRNHMSFKRFLISVLLVVAILRVIRVANDCATFRGMETKDICYAQYVFEDGYWFKMYMRPTFIWGGFWEKELFVIDSNGERYKRIWDSYYGGLFVAWSDAMVKNLDGAYSQPIDALIERIKVGGGIRGPLSPYWLLVVDAILAINLVGILYLMSKCKRLLSDGRDRK